MRAEASPRFCIHYWDLNPSGLEGLKNFVLDRAGGNRFFVEELVRTLVDRKILEGSRQNYKVVKPISGNEIPPTVQAVLAARIDALPKAEKRLLQEAAVIGILHSSPALAVERNK